MIHIKGGLPCGESTLNNSFVAATLAQKQGLIIRLSHQLPPGLFVTPLCCTYQ